ncbi:hypothetical protein COEREDRAFT_87530 [Coemansia reversa NRRL 1564]|uniref:Barwin domain-containing protein n=1 Tax=Coemansia reversa (strain ATCC 12441 / NRRL 1564) TaxID=763665 RepID=A0A2G5B9W5_COERN|nr:hypothetical protein COEREDRAFT_87530 [Coemansia reversa NRRL 1564]|eukprot:PIA15780.1 hypothetical protein COEREDRAFT_87530 [Coemansia reversa NRRL 1564]
MGIGRFAFTTVAYALVVAQQTLGNLTGAGTITYHDFQSLPMNLLVNNPPSCGMPYAQLDVTRITAVQQMDKSTDCGQCIKVCNAEDTSKYVYVLAVDTGGRGLDLSKPSFGKLFNIDDGLGSAQWEPVNNSNCEGIWNNGAQNPGYPAVDLDATSVTTTNNKPATAEQLVVSSPPVVQPTPSQEHVAVPPPSQSPVDQTTSPSVSRTSSFQQQPVAESEIVQQDTGLPSNEAVQASSTPEQYSFEDSELVESEGVAHDAEFSSDSLLEEENELLSENIDTENSKGLAIFSTLSMLLLCTLVSLSTTILSI